MSEVRPLGDCVPGGVAVGEYISGCESKLNIDVTIGAVLLTAYDICDVKRGGRCDKSSVSPIGANRSFPLCPKLATFESIGSVAPCRKGLNVDILDDSTGR